MFEEIKNKFDTDRASDEGTAIMEKVSKIINNVGRNFLDLDGAELAEAQAMLAGYKFYLADYIADLNRTFESIKLEIKQIKADKWDEVTEEIKARDGRVKNKEQIENKILSISSDLQAEQILYETLYYKYKLKISSVDSILTAITQRVAELRRQLGQIQ